MWGGGILIRKGGNCYKFQGFEQKNLESEVFEAQNRV